MALNNIQDNSNIVQKYIFNKNQDDWDEFISSKQQWLNGKQYFAIENQVNIVTLFDLLVQKSQEKRLRQDEANIANNSATTFLNEVIEIVIH